MSSVIPGSEYVTDTMALILRIEGRKLGTVARAAFNLVELGNATILLPAMVFAEALYLSEKGRIGIGLADVSNYMSRYPNCKQCPLDLEVVQAAAQITDVPDLHDRLIAGTARVLNWSLITNDPVIQASAWVTTVW
jgi:PIN domain nuclease of toxin-antitoxin system